MLNSIPNVFQEVKNALQYRRDGLKFDIIVSFLRTRDVELKQEKKELGRTDNRDSRQGDSLFTRGRSNKRESGFKKKGRSQSKGISTSKKRGT